MSTGDLLVTDLETVLLFGSTLSFKAMLATVDSESVRTSKGIFFKRTSANTIGKPGNATLGDIPTLLFALKVVSLFQFESFRLELIEKPMGVIYMSRNHWVSTCACQCGNFGRQSTDTNEEFSAVH